MQVPLTPVRAELVVSRSRFLGLLLPVESQDLARAAVKRLKEEHADASHVVHAFCLGDGNSRIAGCSDDGEPPGTAGRPVLDVLSGSGGANALLAVVRWFGGTKLGTGGLVKAYSDTAKAVLAATEWKTLRALVTATLVVPYEVLRQLKTLIAEHEGEIVAEDFAESIALRARIPRENFESLRVRTLDLLRGRSTWSLSETGEA